MSNEWINTKDQLPPEEELILGYDFSEVFLVTFCSDYWRYSHYESKVAPAYWCKIPSRPCT